MHLIFSNYFNKALSRAFFICIAFILLFSKSLLAQNPDRLDYLGTNPLSGGKPTKDTIHKVNIFKKFTWNIRVVNDKDHVRNFESSRPDTIHYNHPDTVYLNTRFTVSPKLVNQLIALRYNLNGSLFFKLDGQVLLATGLFNPDKNNKFSNFSQNDYTNFLIKDSISKIEMSYLPDPGGKIFDLDLNLLPLKLAEKNKEDAIKSTNESYSLGFYYLSFGIIFFIFFLFFKEKIENLYFSFFCIFSALSFLWGNFKLNLLENGQELVWPVLALEFLAIFFAKVLRNKNKSKIPLLVIVCIFALTFIPFMRQNTVSIGKQEVPFFQYALWVALMGYAIISSVYYLIRGMGQKQWEARAIVYIFSATLVLCWVIPVIVLIILASANPGKEVPFGNNMGYFFDVGICVFPLSAAIVLGRRNGINQKQLINQIDEIKKLSEDNLEKEKEKQQILETQKAELERKVTERTQDIIRQKEEIESKKKEIEVKTKEITDNIDYAQRIQSAILPEVATIRDSLKQSFVLYIPKDVVSGDFYSFSEKKGRITIIAGDCTGHGVSGAFMSMIGGLLLNQILNDKEIEEPALILNHLNTSVIDALKQGKNDSNDGMDIAVCSLSPEFTELHFAGANRPLWLVRNKELMVIKPDKFPIGGLQVARERRFTNHVVKLQKNDTIYIFTDGYADQFGGDKGKKLMTAKFKELLLSIQHLDLNEQEIFLKNFLGKWEGFYEQVDDVLVIGIRV